MYANSKFHLLVCLGLGGCLSAADTDQGLETEESTTGTTEQALALSHHDAHAFGGNIFSTSFPPYVTQESDPLGNCSPGTVHALVPRVQWTSNSGGHCEFFGWNSSDDDCRAIITGGTGGGWFGGQCDTWVEEIPKLPAANQGVFSFTASNTNSAQMNTTDYAIALNAGQLLTIGTCGMPGSSFSGDTYLRLFNLSGSQVAPANDDACGELGSQMVYTATAGRSYLIRVGCYSSGSCSGTVAWTIQ